MVMGPPERVRRGLGWDQVGLGWGQLLGGASWHTDHITTSLSMPSLVSLLSPEQTVPLPSAYSQVLPGPAPAIGTALTHTLVLLQDADPA